MTENSKIDRDWLLFLTLSLIFALEKQASAIFFLRSQGALSELGFGFGGYIQSIISTGTYSSCTAFYCDYASRMPLIPFFMAAIAVFWNSQLAGALIKNFLLSLFFTAGLVTLAHWHKKGRYLYKIYWALLAVMVCSLPVIKHASMITYEEGFILEPLTLWCFFFFLSSEVFFSSGPAQNSFKSEKSRAMAISITLLIAFYVFMTKSSMILLFALSFLLAIKESFRLAADRSKNYLVYSMLFCLSLTLLWGGYQYAMTGRLSVMTSWDGQNMFRGANTASLAMYPDITLDRVMDSAYAITRSGELVKIPPTPGREAFRTEREWDQYYVSVSKDWLVNNPALAIKFFFKKMFNFFISIEKTPYSYTNNASAKHSGVTEQIETLTTTGWLLAGRVIELILLAVCIKILAAASDDQKRQAITIILLLSSYAIPYILGFNYERHITPFILMTISCSLALSLPFFAKAEGRQ